MPLVFASRPRVVGDRGHVGDFRGARPGVEVAGDDVLLRVSWRPSSSTRPSAGAARRRVGVEVRREDVDADAVDDDLRPRHRARVAERRRTGRFERNGAENQVALPVGAAVALRERVVPGLARRRLQQRRVARRLILVAPAVVLLDFVERDDVRAAARDPGDEPLQVVDAVGARRRDACSSPAPSACCRSAPARRTPEAAALHSVNVANRAGPSFRTRIEPPAHFGLRTHTVTGAAVPKDQLSGRDSRLWVSTESTVRRAAVGDDKGKSRDHAWQYGQEFAAKG